MEEPIGPSSGSFDFDLLVIGAGAGGQAMAKEAIGFQRRVLLIDLMTPSSEVTGWSSVTMEIIRKLLHQASQVGETIRHSQAYGWKLKETETVTHSWSELTRAVLERVKSSILDLRKELTDCGVTYLSAQVKMVAPHTVEVTDGDGRKARLSAETLVIDAGECHRYPGIPGDRDHCLTSVELYSMPCSPGRTLIVGGSAEGLECAGFLSGLGHPVTVVLPTSDPLPGFDQKMAQKIENYMLVHGVKFIYHHSLSKVEQIDACNKDLHVAAPSVTTGGLRVTMVTKDGQARQEEFDMVVLAVGMEPRNADIGLELVGVKCCPDSGRILVNDRQQTTVDHIYCLSSLLMGRLSSSTLGARSGKLLARRLYEGDTSMCDYANIPFILFTPLEYSACGLSEERANLTFGEANVEVYHSNYWPLEWTLPARNKNSCYVKVICLIPDQERVVGLHVLGPSAGDIVQGFAAAMTCGLTKKQLDATAGLHPISAKVMTSLTLTQRVSEAMIVRGNC